MTTLVKKIKEVCQQFLTVKFQFVSREGNMIADWLARSCLSNDVNLVTINVLMLHVRRLLLEDKIGDPHVRII